MATEPNILAVMQRLSVALQQAADLLTNDRRKLYLLRVPEEGQPMLDELADEEDMLVRVEAARQRREFTYIFFGERWPTSTAPVPGVITPSGFRALPTADPIQAPDGALFKIEPPRPPELPDTSTAASSDEDEEEEDDV